MAKLTRRNFLKTSAGATAALALGGASLPAFARQDVTVRYIAPQWASTKDRRNARKVAFRSVIDLFEAKNPNYKLDEIVGTGDIVGVSQNIENDEGDAYWVEKSWYTQWQEQGLFVDLSQYGAEEGEFFPFTIEYLRSVNGELGGLWHNTDTPLFFYNSDQVEAPPATWEELFAWAADWRANNGNHAFTLPYTAVMQLFGGNFERLGGQWVNEMGAPELFEHRDLLIRIFQPWVDAVQNDLVPGEAVLHDHNSQMPLMYAGDAVGFFGNSNMHIRALEPNLPPDEYELWKAVTLPYPEELEGQQRAYTAGGWVMVAIARPDDAAREEAAAQWVLHATNATSLANTTKAGGWVPTRPSVINDDPFYAEDDIMQTTLMALEEHGYVPPPVPAYNIIQAQIATAVQSAASGQMLLDEALDAAEEAINNEYADLQG